MYVTLDELADKLEGLVKKAKGRMHTRRGKVEEAAAE
jgi:ribosome-associated translation inhibitor RaiA